MSRAVILYHGFITDDTDFGDLYKHLEGMYDEVVRGSYPGHGSYPDYIENFMEFTAVGTFKSVLNTFDEVASRHDHIDVIGFSMGGALATYLSQVRKFDKMVLLAPANKYLNPRLPLESARFYYNLFKDAIIQTLKKRTNLHETVKENLAVYSKNHKISMDLAVKRIIPNYTLSTVKTFYNVIKDCNSELKEITNETLLVWGKLDQLVPIETTEYIKGFCKNNNLDLEIYDDISHLMLCSENADKVIERIVTFLKGEYNFI